MTSRVDELATRRQLLLARSSLQRETAKADAATIGEALSAVDRAVAVAQRLGRSPVLIAVAVVGLVVFRRHPVAAWAMRGIALVGTVRRVGATLQRLAQEPAPSAERKP